MAGSAQTADEAQPRRRSSVAMARVCELLQRVSAAQNRVEAVRMVTPRRN
jgi:hypothetical protein